MPSRALRLPVPRFRALARTITGRAQRGQSLVEFALIMPILVLLMMGLIEFALAFNATLGINRASQDAALMASEAGNMDGADCLILQVVEQDVVVPNNRTNILDVEIQRTGAGGGSVYARNSYSRGGSTTCILINGDNVTVPYTRTSNGYPDQQRCNILAGCPLMSPARTTVDTVGVQIRYRHSWQTPLAGILRYLDGTGPTGTTWTFSKRNVFRMEPML